MATIVFAKRLPQLWIAWIDNTAGEAALKKGYGKDPRVNGIPAAFWALAARQAWSPEFNRVSSAANISDAVSNLRQATSMGCWSQLKIPTDDVIAILAKASHDLRRGRRRLRPLLRRRNSGLGCAVRVAELGPATSPQLRGEVPSRRTTCYIQKKGSLHIAAHFFWLCTSHSGVLCSALVRELTRSELTGVPAATPGSPV